MRKTKTWKEASDSLRLLTDFSDKEPDLKASILKSPFHSYLYAKNVIKGRWPEAECNISSDAAALMYARDVIKGRWEIAERFLAKTPALSYFYAREVVKGRFELGEKNMASSSVWLRHYADLIGALPEKLHAAAALMSFEDNERWIQEYFKKHDKPNG